MEFGSFRDEEECEVMMVHTSIELKESQNHRRLCLVSACFLLTMWLQCTRIVIDGQVLNEGERDR